MSTSKTIAAISTPQAPGGIGIIRISGSEALNVAAKIFRPTCGTDIKNSKGYRAYHGRVFDSGEDIDEAVCLIFRAPRSYTGEDVVELSCHGGLYILKKVLSACFKAGACAAEAGEFTKRAFLNGKMDLSEAEAVMNLISAQGEQAAQAALTALDGALSKEIRLCADKLISAAAHMAAWVDYPDEDIEELSLDSLKKTFTEVSDKLKALLSRFDSGMAATQGVSTVIIGKPNVGKSTLMNLLSGCERSIVTSVAGTTRDIVEESVILGGITLRLADTAGLHETGDVVESIGVDRAIKKLEQAQLVLAVFDGSEKLSEEDKNIISLCKGKKTVAVINKNDLEQKADIDFLRQNSDASVEISASLGEGADKLGREISAILGTDSFNPSAAMLANERQRDCCRRAVSLLEEALTAAQSGVTMDAINVCTDLCIEALLEITGEKASEAVVNEVFAQFCVGK